MGSVERVATFFILSWGWRRMALAMAAGALSALAMPPFDLFPVLFLTLPAFGWIMDGVCADPSRSWLRRLRSGFVAGWWFGFGFFLAGLWWIGQALLVDGEFAALMPLAVMGLPAGLALFWGAAGAFARLLWVDDWRRPLVLALAFGLAEYLRGILLTGFPWNALGYGAMTMPVLMQKASVLGLWGVTILAVLVFATPVLLAPRHARVPVLPFAVVLGIVALDLGFGSWRLASTPTALVENVRLRIVQPAIDQAEKWSPEHSDRNLRLLMDLSTGPGTSGSEGLSGTDILFWPETAFPFVPTERRDALAALGAMIPEGTRLVAGAIRVEPPTAGRQHELAFNAVIGLNERGEIVEATDKTHLVPFGEYLPLRTIAEQLGLEAIASADRGLYPGSARVLLDGGRAGRFLALVCYEIIFPGEAISGSQRPDFVVNLTNDAWFGYTPGPWQHWRQAVIRGVEAGLPVVRAANNGISSVSDANGRVLARLDLGTRGALDSGLPVPLGPTPFQRMGNSIFFAIAGLFFIITLFRSRRGA